MTTLTKTLAAVSAAGFVGGSIIDFGGFNVSPALTATLPMGPVFFGLALIAYMLEKEMAKFDEQEAKRFEPAPAPLMERKECHQCNNCKCQTEARHESRTGQMA